MQMQSPIRKVVIVGGGTAGWMTAAALSKVLQGRFELALVESDDIGTVGVGEATIPMIRLFNQILEINEDEFVRATKASFKLGIEFVNWSEPGSRYIHGFGHFGRKLWTTDFHQVWLKMWLAGKAPDLEAYSINRMACHADKFMRPATDMPNSPLSEIVYAFHFDAGLYAQFLRGYAEARGVRRTEGRIKTVDLKADTGAVESVTLENGAVLRGDLFIDCSGFRSMLLGQTLGVAYEDWSEWLPMNRAVAVPCETGGRFTPYTRATAHGAGWQWRIPLQHRTGNGHVFCSDFMSTDEATQILLDNLDGDRLAEPRVLQFQTGKRARCWDKNVIAVGLSSGFLEPLESTSIHLIQTAIDKIIDFFPHDGFASREIEEFNRQMDFEFLSVRDFIILHYKLTQREDTPFWMSRRQMAVPQTLTDKMSLYESSGRIFRHHTELFTPVGWLQVMHGQGLRPRGYHPLVDIYPEDELQRFLDGIETVMQKCVAAMPSHREFVDQILVHRAEA